MSQLLDFPIRLRSCLETVKVSSLDVEVFPADSANYQYFGRVVSPDFEGMSDGKRQKLVWDRILAMLANGRDQERIAFIYTHAPSEVDKSPLLETSAIAPAPNHP